MKKKTEMEDELRPEYNFSQLTIVARGPGRRSPAEITVTLAPDVARSFPTSADVNKALRLLVKLAKDSQVQAGR